MPNAGLSRECEELSQHKLLAAKGFFSALPRFHLFPGNRGAQQEIKVVIAIVIVIPKNLMAPLNVMSSGFLSRSQL